MRLSLFGSFARGDATDSSDVDFLVDLMQTRSTTTWA
ncbi:MAG TPA: nucleotidyltransferase domain-containing protein [Thermoanaerobaculia bacterium]|nr:nucleotidyltransferase domain-containing protein [Thermoanaerobaculia bacterium]